MASSDCGRPMFVFPAPVAKNAVIETTDVGVVNKLNAVQSYPSASPELSRASTSTLNSTSTPFSFCREVSSNQNRSAPSNDAGTRLNGNGSNTGTPTVSQPTATTSGVLFGKQTFASSVLELRSQEQGTSQSSQGVTTQSNMAGTTGLFGLFGAPTSFGTTTKHQTFSFGSGANMASATPMFSFATTPSFAAISNQPMFENDSRSQSVLPTAPPNKSPIFGRPLALSGTPKAFVSPQTTHYSTGVTIQHMVISAMAEYEAKSLEELRYEDYKENRRFNPFLPSATTNSVPLHFGTAFWNSSFAQLKKDDLIEMEQRIMLNIKNLIERNSGHSVDVPVENDPNVGETSRGSADAPSENNPSIGLKEMLENALADISHLKSDVAEQKNENEKLKQDMQKFVDQRCDHNERKRKRRRSM